MDVVLGVVVVVDEKHEQTIRQNSNRGKHGSSVVHGYDHVHDHEMCALT